MLNSRMHLSIYRLFACILYGIFFLFFCLRGDCKFFIPFLLEYSVCVCECNSVVALRSNIRNISLSFSHSQRKIHILKQRPYTYIVSTATTKKVIMPSSLRLMLHTNFISFQKERDKRYARSTQIQNSRIKQTLFEEHL